MAGEVGSSSLQDFMAPPGGTAGITVAAGGMAVTITAAIITAVVGTAGHGTVAAGTVGAGMAAARIGMAVTTADSSLQAST